MDKEKGHMDQKTIQTSTTNSTFNFVTAGVCDAGNLLFLYAPILCKRGMMQQAQPQPGTWVLHISV